MNPTSNSSQSAQGPRTVYIDSLKVLTATQATLDDTACQWKTPSPAVLSAHKSTMKSVEQALTPEFIARLEDTLLDAANACWEHLRQQDDLPHAQNIGLCVARALVTSAQDWLRPALFVEAHAATTKPLIAAAQFTSSDLNRRFRFNLAELVADDDTFETLTIQSTELIPAEPPAPPSPDLLTRLQRASVPSLLYRAGALMWHKMPFDGPQGSVFVLRTNDLLKQICADLMLRGYSIRMLPRPPHIAPSDTPSALRATISDTVTHIVHAHFQKLLHPHALELFVDKCAKLANNAATNFLAALAPWRTLMGRLLRHRPVGVLTNILLTPETVALHTTLREHGIKLITVQHAVTAELSARTRRYGMSHETSSSDIVLTYNRAAVSALQTSSYASADVAVRCVGAPREFRTLRSVHRTRKPGASIWYVRTSLYHGNLFRLHRGRSDWDMYSREIALIDRVLAQLPHAVVYKPYPALRYLDDDPAEIHARSKRNISLYSQRFDMRYLVARARVLVTAGATSTLTYCLFADRPTIFIDSTEFMPLDKAVLPRAEVAFPVFCDTSPTFYDDLKTYLCQPIAAIETDWETRAVARKQFIETYMDAPVPARDGKPGAVVHRLLSGAS